MEDRSLKPYFVLIGLMVLTSLALAFTVDVNISDEAGIRMELPDRVGPWRGEEIVYCQAPGCGREILISQLQGGSACPKCGGPVGSMTLAEKQMLPPDTGLYRKRYVGPDGSVIFVSIVLSGRERASIHRPQVCLVGQGNEIIRSHVVEVPLENRNPLKVMVLDLLRRGMTPEQTMVEIPSYYAYWFVGKGRETPYHVERMFWMAADRVLRNIAHRWAYIAVMGARVPDSNQHEEQIIEFVRLLYPQMALIPQG